MLKIVILLIFILFSPEAQAQRLFLTVGSHHTSQGNYCEFNPGFLYENKSEYLWGAYRNSNCDWTGVIGKNVYTSKKFMVNNSESYFMLPVGVITGYDSYPVMPLFMPTAVIAVSGNISLAVSVIPLKEPVFGFGLVITDW
jgi:hypothetical protein